MSLPYFPMYPTDFEAKTSHLTLAEDGAYNRLLRLCWMTPGCSIPDDEAWILRRTRARTDEEIAAVRTVISEFFKAEDGRLYSSRLRKEAMLATEAHAKRVAAGRRGGQKTNPLKTNDSAPSNAKAKPKQPEPEPIKNPIVPFDEFWQAFPSAPRKTDRPKAKAAFERIVSGKHKQIEKTDPAKIVEGAQRYNRSNPDPEFVPLPTSWLNGARWENHTTEKTGADFGAFGKSEVVR